MDVSISDQKAPWSWLFITIRSGAETIERIHSPEHGQPWWLWLKLPCAADWPLHASPVPVPWPCLPCTIGVLRWTATQYCMQLHACGCPSLLQGLNRWHSLLDTLLAGIVPPNILVAIAAAGAQKAAAAAPHVAQYALALIDVCVNLHSHSRYARPISPITMWSF